MPMEGEKDSGAVFECKVNAELREDLIRVKCEIFSGSSHHTPAKARSKE